MNWAQFDLEMRAFKNSGRSEGAGWKWSLRFCRGWIGCGQRSRLRGIPEEHASGPEQAAEKG
jgi:hypothetical protein